MRDVPRRNAVSGVAHFDHQAESVLWVRMLNLAASGIASFAFDRFIVDRCRCRFPVSRAGWIQVEADVNRPSSKEAREDRVSIIRELIDA
jgi:hypothetical protein